MEIFNREYFIGSIKTEKVDKKSFNESIYKDQMAVLAVLGGFFELLRPGGKVRIANAIDLDKRKFTENLTGIVQQCNAKKDVVQVSLDKTLGKKKAVFATRCDPDIPGYYTIHLVFK